MLTYGYLAYQAERPKSRAEQRQAEAQVGQLLAALAQVLGWLAKPVRALRRQSVPTGCQCSPEQGSAPGEPVACGAQRRPLAVG